MARKGGYLLYNRIPLVGGWLRRREVTNLAEDQSSRAAAALAEAFSQSDDQKVRTIAYESLAARSDQPSIDAICSSWASTRSAGLAQLMAANGWVATSPIDVRVLSALKNDRLEAVNIVPANGVQPLLQACSDNDEVIAQNARKSIVSLTNPEAVNYLCRTWADSRNDYLGSVIQHANYVATSPVEVHVLSALKSHRWKDLRSLSADGVETLLLACGDSDEDVSQNARKTIVSLQNQQAIDYLCQKWCENRSGFLDRVIEHAKYVAKLPLETHILSSLRTGKYTALLKAGREIVPILIDACGDPSEEVAKSAASVSRRLRNREAQDAVCKLVIDDDDEMARRIAKDANYAPTDEHDRALYYFLTEQWERYEDLDFDRHLLQAVYETAPASLKARITDRLRRSGRSDFLQIISGGDYRARAGAMTPTESDFVVQMLKRNAEWEKLWALAIELPFFSSAMVVRILVEAGWRPSKPDDVELLTELIAIVGGDLPESVDEISPHIPPAVLRAKARVTGRVGDIAFSPTRPWIAIAGKHQIVVWDFQTGAQQETFRGFKRSVGPIIFTADNALACSEGMQQGRESILHCWFNGNRFHVKHSDMITSMCSAGGSKVLITRYDRHAVLWDAETRRTLNERGLSFWPRASQASANGERALLLHAGVALVDLPDIAIRAKSSGRIGGGVSRCAAFAPDGKSQIVGNFNGDIFVTKRNGNRLSARRRKLTKCDGQAQGLEVLGDQGIVVVAGAGGRVDFISWKNETLIGSVTSTGKRLTSLHVSPGGEFMALGDSDSTMSFWDLRVMQVSILFSIPFSKTHPSHLAAVQALVTSHELPEKVRRAVTFMACILRYRFRYDIEVAEIHSIRVGEFDIEID